MKNKSVTIPQNFDIKSQKTINKLNKKSGIEFEKAYIEFVITDHEAFLNQLSDTNINVSDNDLRDWINNTEILLQNHIEKAKQIKNILEGDN